MENTIANYEKVLLEYIEKVQKKDLDAIAKTLLLAHDDTYIHIPLYHKEVIFNKKTGDITEKNRLPLDTTEKLLAIHHLYFTIDNPRPPMEFVAFREVRGLEFFDANYQLHTITPLGKYFDGKPKEFLRRGIALGGTKEEFGDVSFKIHVFPLVELIFIFWDGEDGIIPPATNIMFNKNIPDFIHLESIPVLAKTGAHYLMNFVDR